LPRILATDVLKKYISASRTVTKGLESEFVSGKDAMSYAIGLVATTESIISDTW